MELSAILTDYYPQLARAEQSLVSNLTGDVSSSAQERYEQQMKALSDARSILKQLPDRKTSDRQSKAEKATVLKERLKMLKQMLPFMSPSAVKSLKAELKQIASQLASLQEGGGNAAIAGGESIPAAPATLTGADTTGTPTDAGSEAGSDSATEQQSAAAAEGSTATTSADSYLEQANKSKAESTEARAMRETIEELKQLYRSVRSMMQRKLQQGGDKGTPVADLPTQLQAYLALPDSTAGLAIKA